MHCLQFSEGKFRKISKVLSKFPNICLFCLNERKINARFVKCPWKICYNNAFSQFSEEEFSEFWKIFSKFRINCLFCPNTQRINAWFVEFFEKHAKIMDFGNFWWKLFRIFKIFLEISHQCFFFQTRKNYRAVC